MNGGFESYAVDLRRGTATYYLPDGESVEISAHMVATAIAPNFDAAGNQSAIGEAQQLVPGYTYKGFCEKVAAAGCAGYLVSFSAGVLCMSAAKPKRTWSSFPISERPCCQYARRSTR